MNDLFYVLGAALVVIALALSFGGMRSEKFPASRGVLLGGLTAMAVLVVATCAWAISLAREEKEHRSHELEEFFAEQEAEATAEQPSAPTSPDEAKPVDKEPPTDVLQLSSPAAGDLVFEPDSLSAAAGTVSISYTNPSPVPHNVAIEGQRKTVVESSTVSGGDAATASTKLAAGTYAFFCTIPGHREAGMEGQLTVK